MPELQSLATRWLGVGLAACLAVVTLALALTGQLGLYINPDSAWFAVSMAVLLLVGAVVSCLLPLGAEADHGHDHGHGPGREAGHEADPVPAADAGERARHDRAQEHSPVGDHRGRGLSPAAVFSIGGGILATGVVATMLVTPAASLSAELAMSRDVGTTPLFAGADEITLASSGDTSEFGVGQWASAFATSTNPDAFEGDAVSLTGFVTPGSDGTFDLTRLVITHCVIDAQPASLPIAAPRNVPETGQWVEVHGTIRTTSDGLLQVAADEVTLIDEPQDPYEY